MPAEATSAETAPSAEPSQEVPKGADAAPVARTPRAGTKQARLIKMLRAEGGATIAEIVTALEWQPHTVRGALSGALRKKHGLTVTSRKDGTRARLYSIVD